MEFSAALGRRTEGSSLVGPARFGRLVVVIGAFGHHLRDGIEKRLEPLLAQRLRVIAGRGQSGSIDELMADEAIKAVADPAALR